MTFTSAPEPLKLELYYRRLGEFMANNCGEPVEEHIWPESKAVGARDGCPGTLELVSEPCNWSVRADNDRHPWFAGTGYNVTEYWRSARHASGAELECG
ncbi:hypothetical protein NW759_017349 [Fusarium solani]|nr:hypothetical protein NW759_017349 [Fusarium solani]